MLQIFQFRTYLIGWSLNSHYIPDTQPWKDIFHLPSSYPPQLSCRLGVSSEKRTFVENNEKHSRGNSWNNRRTVNYILLFSVKVLPIMWFADVFDESFVINDIHHAFFTCFQDEALMTCLRNVINWKLHNAVCHLILSPWALSHLGTLSCLSVICYSMFALPSPSWSGSSSYKYPPPPLTSFFLSLSPSLIPYHLTSYLPLN